MNPGNVHANVKESVEVCGDAEKSVLGEVTTTIGEYCWLFVSVIFDSLIVNLPKYCLGEMVSHSA